MKTRIAFLIAALLLVFVPITSAYPDSVQTPELQLREATSTAQPTVLAMKKAPSTLTKMNRKRLSKPKGGAWRKARVSWYGPGFYGHTMAGGGKLRRNSMVVAHKTMRFGTAIEIKYRGRTCRAVVRDRGPFVAGRTFDLGPGTAKALGFSGVGSIKWRVVKP
jgi:rare lipoprotein A (peptidoglycan hydrolase)